MKKTIFFLVLFLWIGFSSLTYATQWCCSWHWGENFCWGNWKVMCNDWTESPTCTCSTTSYAGFAPAGSCPDEKATLDSKQTEIDSYNLQLDQIEADITARYSSLPSSLLHAQIADASRDVSSSLVHATIEYSSLNNLYYSCLDKEWRKAYLESIKEDAKNQAETTAQLMCPISLGPNAKTDGNWHCACKDWYMFNKDKTSCIKSTQSTTPSLINNNYDCNILPWYIWSSNACITMSNYCDTELPNSTSKTFKSGIETCLCNDWYAYTRLSSGKYGCYLITPDNELPAAIAWMYNKWLTSYSTVDKFLPNDYLTREQASKIFVKFANNLWKKDTNHKNNKFVDIKNADSSLKDYIWQAYSMWIINWKNNRFAPFNKLTIAQAVAIIIRISDGMQNENNAQWYSEYYVIANNYRLFDWLWFDYGTLDSTNITRGEVALLLYRYDNYKYHHYE
jgi:hypothetical protein